MKKSLTKLLARMAKDGDVETVAEIIEEMIGEEEVPAETAAAAAAAAAVAAEAAAGPAAKPAAEPAGDPAVVVETEQGNIVAVDEESLAGLYERLDQIIGLLTRPAPAADEEPEELPEEIAEVVEEALEAIETEEGTVITPEAAEEVAEIVGEILDPEVSVTLEGAEETGDECDDPENQDCDGRDTRRDLLMAVRPSLRKMNRADRKETCADLAVRMYRTKKAKDRGAYLAMAAKKRPRAKSSTDLGKKIMAARNINMKK